ncbi:chorismate mutase [Salinibacter ruber]|jgi:chorismate mutase|nr:chorismate mutase [Salinibacter ruber]MCS3632229.1 chorismate mutase [Salinibacter ruber]MCS3752728.1 chorismate mutase [Salinibacter ruber]MCS4039996.1 chorismate mutase [Salinibacter ruber]MCS4049278.1 chorismate mutase [Salinibacter ruber]MCS4055844.1 chorismate mutase [Salinibacter ruber]
MSTSSSPTTVPEARARIDEINERVVELLAERQAIVDDLCELKADADRTVRDPEREAELLAHVRSVADEAGLPPTLAETLFEEILAHSVERQRRQRADGAAGPSAEESSAEELSAEEPAEKATGAVSTCGAQAQAG